MIFSYGQLNYRFGHKKKKKKKKQFKIINHTPKNQFHFDPT